MILQVLYAIGMSFVAMAFLRRLSTYWLLCMALFLLLGGDAIVMGLRAIWPEPTLVEGFLYTRSLWFRDVFPVLIVYPIIPWLAMMMLGWVCDRLQLSGDMTDKHWLFYGLVAVAIFLVVRGLNGYGNADLLRDDMSFLQWLHVSKYPPSISFTTMTLGAMALILYAMSVWVKRKSIVVNNNGPLLVFGQTALFFYVLHKPFMTVVAEATELRYTMGPTAVYGMTLFFLVLMYPVCRKYRAYKAAHPNGWTRYL